jgi:hypothetical protein
MVEGLFNMNLQLGALGFATGVVAGVSTHFLGKKLACATDGLAERAVHFIEKKLGQKVACLSKDRAFSQYAPNLLCRTSPFEETSLYLRTSLIDSALIALLQDNSFTIGLKVGMTATSGFLIARGVTNRTYYKMMIVSNPQTGMAEPMLIEEKACSKISSALFGATISALASALPVRGLQVLSYLTSNSCAYYLGRNC